MRRHEAVTRIFLFCSIVNFTFAGIAKTPTMHEMSVDLVTRAESITEVSERRHTQSEALPEWSARSLTTGNLHTRLETPRAVNPDDDKFFSKEMTRKMKEYLILGSVAGLFIGVGNGIQKEIMGTVSPGAQTIGRSVEPLIKHSQDQEGSVSRSLSSMSDEDLEMLSIISRRMLNSLD